MTNKLKTFNDYWLQVKSKIDNAKLVYGDIYVNFETGDITTEDGKIVGNILIKPIEHNKGE